MSFLRWFGLATGLLLLLFLFVAFRRSRIRRGDFLVGMLLAIGLSTISLFPGTVNLLRAMLSLQDEQFSRLIAICIVSNILLWLLLVYTRVQSSNRNLQFDRLVRSLGSEEFERLYSQSGPLPKVVVVMPAYDEADNIGSVLASMPKSAAGERLQTIVIDDGSIDGTFEEVRRCGALAVRSRINRGGGAALRMGFDIARRAGAEIVVTMDADGQHLPSEIEQLVTPILDDRLDFVIGSRILGEREKDSSVRYLGILVFNAVIRLLTPVRITDCSSGFRAMRVRDLNRVDLRQDQFHSAELIIEAARKGIRIGEVGITIKRRMKGQSKKGHNLVYGLSFARTVLRTWWR